MRQQGYYDERILSLEGVSNLQTIEPKVKPKKAI
jgi:hypothetical protein